MLDTADTGVREKEILIVKLNFMDPTIFKTKTLAINW